VDNHILRSTWSIWVIVCLMERSDNLLLSKNMNIRIYRLLTILGRQQLSEYCINESGVTSRAVERGGEPVIFTGARPFSLRPWSHRKSPNFSRNSQNKIKRERERRV
jgi:hypothetical protein